MFSSIDIGAAKDILEESAVFASCGDGIKLTDIRAYGKILRAYQWLGKPEPAGFPEETELIGIGSLAREEKTVVVIQVPGEVSIEDIKTLHESVLKDLPDTLIVTVPWWNAGEKGVRITAIIYQQRERTPRYSGIRLRYHYLEVAERRELKNLERELGRMENRRPLAMVGRAELEDLMEKHHVLWHGAAASNRCASEVLDVLCPRIQEQAEEYDVTGMFIILDVDTAFTTLSELIAIRDGLASMLEDEAEIAVSVRAEPTHIKHIDCCIFLFGNPKYVSGNVYMDYGRYEILLYKSEDKERGHIITASIEDGKLTVSRYDWGDFESNRSGRTDEHVYLDQPSTLQLCETLKAKRPETLLRKLRSRFAEGYHASVAEESIKRFCKDAGIVFDTRYYD